MKIEDIEKLIESFDRSSLTRLVYETEEETLKLSKKKEAAPGAVPAIPVAQAPDRKEAPVEDYGNDPSIVRVKSTYVGTICLNDEKTGKPLVTAGSRVKKGQVLCQIEAMKMYNDVKAPVSGQLLSLNVENGAVVQYDTLIATIKNEE